MPKGVYERTSEARKSIGTARRGQTMSAETRQKISATMRGHTVSAETRAKISANNAMKRPEVRAKLAKSA